MLLYYFEQFITNLIHLKSSHVFGKSGTEYQFCMLYIRSRDLSSLKIVKALVLSLLEFFSNPTKLASLDFCLSEASHLL